MGRKDTISINDLIRRPKYRQIEQSVVDNISSGKWPKGHQLPSINTLAQQENIAKETVAKAYAKLKEQRVIDSIHGKGFYVSTSQVTQNLNVFVLFDTFNAYKEILYHSLKKALPENTQFSIFFHHYSVQQLEQLIAEHNGEYHYYVIMPHFDTDVSEIIQQIPREKLIILDHDLPKLNGNYAAVYQDFEKDVYQCLLAAKPELQRYHHLRLLIGKEHFQYVPKQILQGFRRFCKKHQLNYTIEENYLENRVVKGDAWLIFHDADLVRFIKYSESKRWKLGKDIGLISYDDTPLKELLLGGITVITTDFASMGTRAAELILERKLQKIANPPMLIKRKTL